MSKSTYRPHSFEDVCEEEVQMCAELQYAGAHSFCNYYDPIVSQWKPNLFSCCCCCFQIVTSDFWYVWKIGQKKKYIYCLCHKETNECLVHPGRYYDTEKCNKGYGIVAENLKAASFRWSSLNYEFQGLKRRKGNKLFIW